MSAEALAGYNRVWRLLRPLIWLYLQFGWQDKRRTLWKCPYRQGIIVSGGTPFVTPLESAFIWLYLQVRVWQGREDKA